VKWPLQILAVGTAALLLAAGCSKDKQDADATDPGSPAGNGNVPPVTKLQTATQPRTPDTVARKTDGLWYEGTSASPYTGRVVHEEDDQRWEEKFEKGVRTFLRAWDKDGEPVELHSWNADGSPKN
jgi:hypothetical protein